MIRPEIGEVEALEGVGDDLPLPPSVSTFERRLERKPTAKDGKIVNKVVIFKIRFSVC